MARDAVATDPAGIDEFDLMRAVAATQQRSAELLDRARIAAREIEASSRKAADEIRQAVEADVPPAVAAAFAHVESRLAADRRAVTAALGDLEAQLTGRAHHPAARVHPHPA